MEKILNKFDKAFSSWQPINDGDDSAILSREILPSDILPHKGRCLFIDKIVEYNQSDCKIRVLSILQSNKHYWDVNEGGVNSTWLIEIMAQAVATLFGMQSQSEKEKSGIRLGFLIAIDNFELVAPEAVNSLKLADRLITESKMEVDLYPFGIYESNVFLNSRPVASSRMKFMISDNLMGEMQGGFGIT